MRLAFGMVCCSVLVAGHAGPSAGRSLGYTPNWMWLGEVPKGLSQAERGNYILGAKGLPVANTIDLGTIPRVPEFGGFGAVDWAIRVDEVPAWQFNGILLRWESLPFGDPGWMLGNWENGGRATIDGQGHLWNTNWTELQTEYSTAAAAAPNGTRITRVLDLLGDSTAQVTLDQMPVIARLVVTATIGDNYIPGVQPPHAKPHVYVALGDSYSSGEGNPPFDNILCRRSSQAWPVKAAALTGITLDRNLACSGAHIAHLTQSWPARGQGPQIGTAALEHPDVVSLTIGGNDLGFSSVLGDCYTSVSPFAFGCDTDGSIASVRNYLPTLQTRLVAVYRTMKAKLSGAHIVVVGYPRIFPTVKAHNCAWLSDSERKSLVAVSAEIDHSIAAAAAAAGVTYVSVLDVLGGHELCTAQSWVNPIEPSCGLPGHTDCGHPTSSGQLAIAKRVQTALMASGR
jgi:lysophospholipase L1-like esterase